jgi:hypothetical protein
MIERQIEIATQDGQMNTFICHPERGGPYAVNAAVRHPERIRAAASIYGVALATDKPNSPHLAVQHTDARLFSLFAAAL